MATSVPAPPRSLRKASCYMCQAALRLSGRRMPPPRCRRHLPVAPERQHGNRQAVPRYPPGTWKGHCMPATSGYLMWLWATSEPSDSSGCRLTGLTPFLTQRSRAISKARCAHRWSLGLAGSCWLPSSTGGHAPGMCLLPAMASHVWRVGQVLGAVDETCRNAATRPRSQASNWCHRKIFGSRPAGTRGKGRRACR
jgi:hypothetical protein